ncbi:magnesium transporter [Parabacteroides sp. PFB2-12]|uniref:CorA family divalent cation transporter n=1 Tax=unclassified Parabacteroides TaxID=2649774 RepID=UPI002476ACDD|nr:MULTISPECIES: CorA family divalent cation transporter [unclassified Parabacteroides]MDH6342010.1 magnesium transporter [Parabacteroides sp. PM6-13]MDH6389708.1 magnesium transporter [Parabacteroides sp. PFB2-12]
MQNNKEVQQHHTNRYFSDKYVYVGHHDTPTTIRLIQYHAEGMEKKNVSLNTPSFRELAKSDRINWFQIQGMTDAATISRLLQEFGVRNIDIRDILTPHHVVKIEDNEDNVLVVMNSCSMNHKSRVASEHIGIIIKERVVITLTESDAPLFKNVENSLKNNTLNIRTQKSGLLLAFLLNSILVDIIEVAAKVEVLLEKLEDGLLAPVPTPKNHIGQYIQECRHANLIIRKNTYPLKEDFPKLIRPKQHMIDAELVALFDDLFDQLKYAIQTSENNKEILSSLMDLYSSNNDLKMNRVMKRLTVVSTLFIPITFLVGLWGMNFKYMPELDWEYGYLVSLGIILITGIGTWLFMKKKRWI